MDPRIKTLKEGELGTRPNWDEYFMHLAIGVSSRSSCHNVHSGTVIVSDKHILATGYNGAPPGIKNCIESGCRKELKGLKFNESYGSGECIGIHSEMNALGHLTKLGNKKISIYTTIFPCHTCAKNILAYDIDKIIFKRFYTEKEIKSTMDLFDEAGIEVYQLDISKKRDMDMRYNRKAKFFGVWQEDENIWNMEKEVKLGKYQHFKGKFYEVIGIAKNSENPNEEFVVYKALYDDNQFGNNALWIRPKQMFLETVNINGEEVPRFRFVE